MNKKTGDETELRKRLIQLLKGRILVLTIPYVFYDI